MLGNAVVDHGNFHHRWSQHLLLAVLLHLGSHPNLWEQELSLTQSHAWWTKGDAEHVFLFEGASRIHENDHLGQHLHVCAQKDLARIPHLLQRLRRNIKCAVQRQALPEALDSSWTESPLRMDLQRPTVQELLQGSQSGLQKNVEELLKKTCEHRCAFLGQGRIRSHPHPREEATRSLPTGQRTVHVRCRAFAVPEHL